MAARVTLDQVLKRVSFAEIWHVRRAVERLVGLGVPEIVALDVIATVVADTTIAAIRALHAMGEEGDAA